MFPKTAIIYLGLNNPYIHKRGVENVIFLQSQNNIFPKKTYIFFGKKNSVFRWENLICIEIKKNLLRFFMLNFILFKLKKCNNLFIHSHNYLMSFFLFFQTSLFTVHDGLFYQYKSMNKNRLFLFKIIEKIVYKKSSFVHFISKFTKENSLFPDKNTNFSIISNSTPFEVLKNAVNPSTSHLQKNKIIFGVRSIEDRALVNLWLDVAELLQEKSYTFILAGKGPLSEFYNQEIKKRKIKNIKLLGYISDLDICKNYATCDLVIVTAKYGEGFGLPIIEGYLFNKPVIASNVCAIPEVIYSPDFLFQNNSQQIIEKIDFAINQKNDNIDFFDYYNKNFSWNYIISQYDSLYKKLLD